MSDVRTCIFTEKSILAEYHMTTSEKKGIIGGTLARGDLQVYGHNSPTPLRPVVTHVGRRLLCPWTCKI